MKIPIALPDDPVLRALSLVTLVNTLGNGLFMTTSALFFTRSVGLTAAQLGLGLAVAGLCGIVAGVPLGHLSDRWGARRMVVVLLAGEAVALLGYTQVHSFAGFLPVACVVTFLDRGASAVRNALIAVALPAEDRVRGRAYLRAVTNVGMGAGAALAAVALQSDSRAAYVAIVAANAATFMVAALMLLRLPMPDTARPAARESHSARPVALLDPPYLLITALSGVLTLQAGVLEVGLPLWVAHATRAPVLVVSVAFVLNTVMVVILQIRTSRGTEEPAHAARACLRAGVVLAVACALYGAAHGLGAAAAVVVILAATVALTLGEMLSAAGGWSLSYELADPAAHGAYQGVFQSGFSAGILLAPLIVAHTALEMGMTGWLLLGGIFLVTGAVFPAATRWALARRGAPAAPAVAVE